MDAIRELGRDTSDGWVYVLDAMRQAKMRSGSFYLALGRLEEEHLIESRWEPDVPPPRQRRQYRWIGSGR